MQGYASLTMGLGVLEAHFAWRRASQADGVGTDRRLGLIAAGGAIGAIVAAKVAFLVTEGARFADHPLALLTGRSVTGALLGGYIGVELLKHLLHFDKATGDRFALVVPLSVAIGRVGCTLDGCCPGLPLGGEVPWWALVDGEGVARWPAAPVEGLFNLSFWLFAQVAVRRRWLQNNLFHLYLVAYGVFRLGHEFLRDDARWVGSFGGYHLMALLMVLLGATRGVQRAYAQRSRETEDGTKEAPGTKA